MNDTSDQVPVASSSAPVGPTPGLTARGVTGKRRGGIWLRRLLLVGVFFIVIASESWVAYRLFFQTLDHAAGGDFLTLILTEQERTGWIASVALLQVSRHLLSAEALRQRERNPQALAASGKALYFSRFTSDRRAYLTALLQRVFLLLMDYRLSEAEIANEVLLRAAQEPRDRLWLAGGQLFQAGIETFRGRYEDALSLLEQAKLSASEVRSPHQELLLAQALETQVSALLSLFYSLLQSSAASELSRQDLEQTLRKIGLPFEQVPSQAVRGFSAVVYQINDRARLSPRLVSRHKTLRVQSGSEERNHRPPPAIHLAPSSCRSGSTKLASGFMRRGRSASTADLLFGAAAFRLGWHGQAMGAWSRELTNDLQTGAPDAAAANLANIAAVHWYDGHFDEAIRQMAAAVACTEVTANAMGAPATLSSFSSSPAHLRYHALIEMLALEGRAREAFFVAEKARSRALLRSLGTDRNPGRARLKPGHPLGTRLERLRQRLSQLERELAVPTVADTRLIELELEKLRQAHRGLSVRAGLLNPELGSVTSSPSVTVEDLQSRLDPDTALVAYFLTDLGAHAWIVEREEFHWVKLPDPPPAASTLHFLAEGVRRRQRGSEVLHEHQRAVEEELYRRLVAPLRRHLRKPRLILVPHGPLHYVSFAALRDPATGRFLVEDFTLTYAPSASSLLVLEKNRSPFGGSALVFGAPSRNETDLKATNWMRQEAMDLGRLLGTLPLLGETASEAALSNLNGAVDILHFAAHAVYFPSSPSYSRMALAAQGGADGNLEVHEIMSSLDLQGVNLIVLSSCETALGSNNRGDEVVSLSRAFLYAGGSAVVSTLWKVDDEASTILMSHFYRRLQAGDSTADALQAAQLYVLQQEGFSSPYYWAGYTLTGAIESFSANTSEALAN